MKRIPVNAGDRFGRLVVVTEVEQLNNRRRFLCDCDCGRVGHLALLNSLRARRASSCGCSATEKRTKHGMAGKARVYSIWQGMLARCNNPKNPRYASYGGRGIKACDRWHRFENFFADMGNPPKDHSLERMDNSKGYSPDNCEWATRKKQSRNMRSNRLMRYGTQEYCLSELAEMFKIKPDTLWSRLNRGWTLEDALEKPIQPRRLEEHPSVEYSAPT